MRRLAKRRANKNVLHSATSIPARCLRFEELELSQTVYDMIITDSETEPTSQGGGPPIPKRPLSTEQAVAYLLEQRDRYGFSYIHVYEGQMENFALVVAHLTTK